jgi:hypothetical protein
MRTQDALAGLFLVALGVTILELGSGSIGLLPIGAGLVAAGAIGYWVLARFRRRRIVSALERRLEAMRFAEPKSQPVVVAQVSPARAYLAALRWRFRRRRVARLLAEDAPSVDAESRASADHTWEEVRRSLPPR